MLLFSGAGIVGTNAAQIAVGMGARVTILDLNHERLKHLDDISRGRAANRAFSNPFNIEETVYSADYHSHWCSANSRWTRTLAYLPRKRQRQCGETLLLLMLAVGSRGDA
jgi:D-arabinose 1-dehydrogenase-like Zn-dependent alcohol dehydrogenase